MEGHDGWMLPSFARRLAAYALDHVLFCLPLWVFAGVFIFTGIDALIWELGDPPTNYVDSFFLLVPFILLVNFVLIVCYGVWWLFALGRGQTPGKQVVGVRVIRDIGESSSWCRTFLREFVKGLPVCLVPVLWVAPYPLGVPLSGSWVDNPFVLAAGIYWLVDHLWPLFDSNRQALHDKIAGTLVVRN